MNLQLHRIRSAVCRHLTCLPHAGGMRQVMGRVDSIKSFFGWRERCHRQPVRLTDELFLGRGAFVDVGANIGEGSVPVAQKHSDGMLIAFEPNSNARDFLDRDRSFDSFPNSQIFSGALGGLCESITPSLSEAPMLSILTAGWMRTLTGANATDGKSLTLPWRSTEWRQGIQP